MIAVKLLIHPLIAFGLMLAVRAVRPALGCDRAADGLAAAGAERVRDRPAKRHLDRAGIGRGADRDLRVRGHADQRDVADPDRAAWCFAVSSLACRHDGASPSRMASRRSGPIEPSRCRPAARAVCTGRKSDSSERLATSITKVRLADVAAPRRSIAAERRAARRDRRPSTIASRTMPAMSAASRSPILRPCAPIGGTTCADSPTSAMRFLAICRGCSMDKRKFVPARLDRDAAENGMRLLLDGVRQLVVVERDQPLGLLRRRHPDHAAAVAGQGHEHARAVRRVKFGRDVLVRPGMADVEGQRGLVEIAPRHLDAGGLAAQRLPPVGADHEARGSDLPLRG